MTPSLVSSLELHMVLFAKARHGRDRTRQCLGGLRMCLLKLLHAQHVVAYSMFTSFTIVSFFIGESLVINLPYHSDNDTG